MSMIELFLLRYALNGHHAEFSKLVEDKILTTEGEKSYVSSYNNYFIKSTNIQHLIAKHVDHNKPLPFSNLQV